MSDAPNIKQDIAIDVGLAALGLRNNPALRLLLERGRDYIRKLERELVKAKELGELQETKLHNECQAHERTKRELAEVRERLVVEIAERNAEFYRAERHWRDAIQLRGQLVELRERCERAETKAPQGGEVDHDNV